MKALSIRQPWAWAILHAGKDVENRDWADWNHGLKFRGPFLIHASAGMSKHEYEEFIVFFEGKFFGRQNQKVPAMAELPRGGFVGRASIDAVIHENDGERRRPEYLSDWFFGPYGLCLSNVGPLPFVPFKGMLGFFDVPADLVPVA